MLCIFEDVGRGLIDWNRPRSRFGVRAVACVQRTGTEAEDVVRGVPVIRGQARKLAIDWLVRHMSIVRGLGSTDLSLFLSSLYNCQVQLRFGRPR